MIPTPPSQSLSPFARGILLLACLRPHLLLPAYLAAATGLVSRLRPGAEWSGTTEIRSATAFLGWSLVLASIHVVNLLADRDTDRLNEKNLFWMEDLPGRSLALTAGLLATVGLAIAGWGHPVFLVPVGSTLLLGWAYCLRPLLWSRRWGWDALANVLGYGVLAPWLGALLVVPAEEANRWNILDGGFPTAAILHLVPLVFAGFLLTTLLDREGDRLTGKRTWAVRFSPNGTRALATGILVATGLGALFGFPDPGGSFNGGIGGLGGPASWCIRPGSSHLMAAVLAGMAGLGTARRRRILIGAIFLAVLAAGGPALLALPRLGLPLAGWLAASYLLLRAAGKITDR